MKRIILIIVSLFLVTSAWAKDKDAQTKQSVAENIPFTGAYFVQNLAGDPATNVVMVFNSEGTFTESQASMFCAMGFAGCELTSPAQGAWKKTGENEISVVYIKFITPDQDVDEFINGGSILKITWVQTFDDLQGGVFQNWVVNSFVAEGYLFDQNPLTDEPQFTVEVDSSPFGGQRINVE